MNEKVILREIASISQKMRRKVAERDVLNIEIMQLEEKVRNLRRAFVTDTLTEEGKRLTAVGLTEAIRTALRRSGKPMTGAEVKAALGYMGFDLERFSNPAAAVHNTLARMAKAGEITYLEESKTYRMPLAMFYGR
jgi:phage host-nuclease inhibitor protein Gam